MLKFDGLSTTSNALRKSVKGVPTNSPLSIQACHWPIRSVVVEPSLILPFGGSVMLCVTLCPF